MIYKATVFIILLVLSVLFCRTQVLFTYGPHKVTKQEFLKAFNKNNTQDKPTLQAYRDYLDLFIRFKIKVQAAKDKRMDTLPNQKAELSSFRSQVLESFINDEASTNLMVDEAFQRSQKEIHLAHIFIPVPKNANGTDTLKAKQLIEEAYEKLNNGGSFSDIAIFYSKDPAVVLNKGDMGVITVFGLPYGLESLAYNTPVGKHTKPFRSKAGWHIFRKTAENKSRGKVRVAQILIPYPPEATEIQKNEIQKRTDSLINLLSGGADFKALAASYSGDNYTYQNGGELPEFGVGHYEIKFENAAFSLKEGEISQPLSTSFGYHILKGIRRISVNEDPSNKNAREELKQQVLLSDRMEVAKKNLVNSITRLVKFKKYPVSEKSFRFLTNNILERKKLPVLADLKISTPLFAFEKQTITVKDWVRYLESMREVWDFDKEGTHTKLYDAFVESSTLEYYRNHLEQYNPDFAYQLKEFKEGNLLFEIMQKNIWDQAAADSVALKSFYEKHRNNYWWDNSADALIFTVASQQHADNLNQQLRNNFHNWKMYIDSSQGSIQGDSGRFELSQIPVVDRTNFTKGLITAPVKNETDNSLTFAFIISMYPGKEPRIFEDARGFVINDYQNFLEDKWITTVKKKYPVKVNEGVLRSLVN